VRQREISKNRREEREKKKEIKQRVPKKKHGTI
jgi:hypothetical protein